MRTPNTAWWSIEWNSTFMDPERSSCTGMTCDNHRSTLFHPTLVKHQTSQVMAPRSRVNRRLHNVRTIQPRDGNRRNALAQQLQQQQPSPAKPFSCFLTASVRPLVKQFLGLGALQLHKLPRQRRPERHPDVRQAAGPWRRVKVGAGLTVLVRG